MLNVRRCGWSSIRGRVAFSRRRLADSGSQLQDHAAQAQEKNLLRRQGRPRNGSRTRRQSQTIPTRPREEDEAGEAQAHARQIARRRITDQRFRFSESKPLNLRTNIPIRVVSTYGELKVAVTLAMPPRVSLLCIGSDSFARECLPPNHPPFVQLPHFRHRGLG